VAPEKASLPANVGRFQILRELGRGGTAVVYLARIVGPGGFERLFALKMIHGPISLQTSFVDALLNEARIASKLHHPNVISVFEMGEHQGRHYLVMDYVPGENLANAFRGGWTRDRPPPIDIAAHIILSASQGLHAAHELKDAYGRPLDVVHRDVTPQNIIIGHDGIVRVMDFGIAKAANLVSVTRPGTIKGTAAYMSPEQVRGEPLDRRTDVFALGVMLWETTLGARLFKSTSYVKTASQVLMMPIPRPSSVRPGYPPMLEAIVMRALARDPEKRHPTAKALGDDLDDFFVKEGKGVASADIERFLKRAIRARDRIPEAAVSGPFAEQRTVSQPNAFDERLPTVCVAVPGPEEPDTQKSRSPIPPGSRNRMSRLSGAVAAGAPLLSIAGSESADGAPDQSIGEVDRREIGRRSRPSSPFGVMPARSSIR
jgi:serine/threonine-protein kinase